VKTVLIAGLGDLGGWALEFLARSEGVDRIVTLRRSREAGVPRTHLAAIGSVFQGHAKQFEHLQHDLSDVEETVRLLERIRPDVILSTATAQSPRLLMQADVSPETRELLRRARFSIWLPWHLLPASHLTAAVVKLGERLPVINIAFPDVVNPALWRHFGFGPVAGAGNAEITAATIIRYVSQDQGVPLQDITLALVGSHAFFSFGPAAGVPFFCKVLVLDRDLTDRYDLDDLVTRWPSLHDWSTTSVFSAFAASIVKNALGILRDTREYTHVTAPNGLPGAYPARLSAGGVEIVLPEELALEKAIEINTTGNRFDGIEEIRDDGTVVYTDEAYQAMRELGYDCREVTFDALEARAEELDTLFRKITID
jgi:hypothetical protein